MDREVVGAWTGGADKEEEVMVTWTELKGEGIKEVQEVMAGRARETDGEEAAGEA